MLKELQLHREAVKQVVLKVAATHGSAINDVLGLILTLDERFLRLEAELAHHCQQEGTLFLREMGRQMQNKLARLCVPGVTTAVAAKHITLRSIPERRGVVNLTEYNQILAEFPGLKQGLGALKNLGVPTAHSFECSGESRPVTGEYLNVLIQKHFGDADEETQVNVQSVRRCLLTLAGKLREPIFVITERAVSA